MNVVFFQTADPFKYARMLQVTSRTVTEYCKRNGFGYESYLGIKRGPWPWEAAYNRIIQLKELVDRGFDGWAIHLDADAYIVDLDFDLRAYLADKQDYAAILTPSMATDAAWDINDGVGFFNLGHPTGREIVAEWNRRFEAVSDERLVAAEDWIGPDDDQDLIQTMLRSDPNLMASVFLQSTELMNSTFATFIRQHMRGYSPNFEQRMFEIEQAVGAVMADVDPAVPQLNPAVHDHALREIVEALYLGLLGRPADAAGADHSLHHLRTAGLLDGVSTLARQIIRSEEFSGRTS